jgi:hypothetical protein
MGGKHSKAAGTSTKKGAKEKKGAKASPEDVEVEIRAKLIAEMAPIREEQAKEIELLKAQLANAQESGGGGNTHEGLQQTIATKDEIIAEKDKQIAKLEARHRYAYPLCSSLAKHPPQRSRARLAAAAAHQHVAGTWSPSAPCAAAACLCAAREHARASRLGPASRLPTAHA